MKFYSILISAMIILISCSDDSNNPSVDKDYFPYNIGNYWIYEVKELDGGSNPINDIGIDSLVVVGKTIINEKQAAILHVFRNDMIFDTLYLSVENESLYQLRDESTDWIPGFYEWIEVINLSNDNWFMYRYSSEYYQYEYDDTIYTAEAQFVYNGFNNGQKNVLIPSTVEEYETLHFSNKLDTKIEFDFMLDSVKKYVSIIQNLNMDFYMSDGIGMVLQTYRPSIQFINNEPNYFNGWQRQLIRHRFQIIF